MGDALAPINPLHPGPPNRRIHCARSLEQRILNYTQAWLGKMVMVHNFTLFVAIYHEKYHVSGSVMYKHHILIVMIWLR